MRNLVFVAFAAGTIGVSACSSTSGPTDPSPTDDVVAAESIIVLPSSIQLATAGDSRRLTIWFEPVNATDRDVSWSSSNPAAASVDANGLVTAIAQAGEVIITATSHDGGHQSSARVRLGNTPAIQGDNGGS